MKLLLILAAALIIVSTCGGQSQTPEKKPLNHNVYDGWKRVSGESISNDGKWVVYSVEPQEGDAHLVLFNMDSKKYDTIPRGLR